jgi:molybdenum cofactor synthesis domain-containing protein
VRAGIVVTGTEVLTGRVTDRNGPWLAEELRRRGVDVGQVVVVGDRPDDLAAALRYLAGSCELVITSGGLGPTADDLTAEVVAGVQGRALRRDPDLEKRITAIVDRLMARLSVARDPEATAAGVRKQALVPGAATVLEPTGTAPGLVVTDAAGQNPPVVVLPGPPRELRSMWPAALEAPAVRSVLAAAGEIRQRTLRLWGLPEAELAALLRRVDDELTGLEITTCLRDGELEIVSRYAPAAEPAHERLLAAVRAEYGDQLFSDDGREVDELVAAALADRGWNVAVVESLTGGAMSARLTRALDDGTSVVRGAVVGREARQETSSAAATSMAQAARDELEAEVGIGVTAVDPADAPATTVHVAVVTPGTERRRTLTYDAPPALLRARVPTVAMHLLREALSS